MTAVEMDPVTHAVIAHQVAYGVTMVEVATALVREAGLHRAAFTNDATVRKRMPNVRDIVPHGRRGLPIHLPAMLGRFDDGEGTLRLAFRELEIGDHAVLNRVDGKLRVVIEENLPDSVIAAAHGAPLSRIVSHHALDRLGIVVRRAYNLPEGQTFNIRDGTRRMGAAFVVDAVGTVCLKVDPIGTIGSRIP